MLLNHALKSDYAAVVDLVNEAYRGTGSGTSLGVSRSASWNIETGIIEGQRLNESLLIEELAAKPKAHLLLYRDEPDGPLLGRSGWSRNRRVCGISVCLPSGQTCKTDNWGGRCWLRRKALRKNAGLAGFG